MTKPPTRDLSCDCGAVRVQVEREPIVSTECYCTSCRTAGARLQALPDVPPILGANGGTRYILYRKDRVHFLAGTDQLRTFRLTPQSPTRRVVAACCNSPIFLEFQNGHWLSLYGRLWPADALPPLDLRTMTSDLPEGTVLPEDVPNGRRQSLRFFALLLGAWIAMGFRSPRLALPGGDFHVPPAPGEPEAAA